MLLARTCPAASSISAIKSIIRLLATEDGIVRNTPTGRKPAAWSRFLVLLLSLLLPAVRLCSQPAHARLIYSHSLLNATPAAGESIVNSGGGFVAGKGWQATTENSQLRITLASALPFEGTFIINVTNFDPVSQNLPDDIKQHIINLYSRIYDNNKDIFETDGSWCNIRTGVGYSTGEGVAGFKFLAAARGIDTRDEERCIEDHTWSLTRTYEFKIIWTATYIYCYLDGSLMSRLPFAGQIEPFRYLLIGRDNLIWGYGAQPGVIFSNVRIYGPQSSPVQLSGRLLLQGAYEVGSHAMRTPAAGAAVPLQSPFPQAPYAASTVPAGIVDWVLVGLRSTPTGAPVVERSLWLRSDGRLIDPATAGTTVTLAAVTGSYYVTVQTRNHLAAMSATALVFDGLNASNCDFTTGTASYYGGKGAVLMEAGVWALQAGDINGDKAVTAADFSLWQSAARTGTAGYAAADLNLDGWCTTRDYVLWFENARASAASGMP